MLTYQNTRNPGFRRLIIHVYIHLTRLTEGSAGVRSQKRLKDGNTVTVGSRGNVAGTREWISES